MFRVTVFLVVATLFLTLTVGNPAVPGEKSEPPWVLSVRRMEKLGRGVVAVHQGEGKVFVSWRLLGTDPEAIAFHLYRASGDAEPVRLTRAPLTRATCFEDRGVVFTRPVRYFVRPVLGSEEGDPGDAGTLKDQVRRTKYQIRRIGWYFGLDTSRRV